MMKLTGTFITILLVLSVEPTSALLGKLFKKKNEASTSSSNTKLPKGPTRLPPKILDNKGLDYIFDNNKEWKKENLSKDKDFYKKLGQIQNPEYMWIGCSDARVPPNVIMGEDSGNIFVHRNVANMVINNDLNFLSALQYGVANLKVKDIIVCGHYECGGIRAAEMKNDFVEPLEEWLSNIRDVYRVHKKELDTIKDGNERHRRLVDLNVVEQCLNIFKTGVVQKRRKESYEEAGEVILPRVHAMVFDPKTGNLKRVPFDFSDYEEELTNIYGVYTID